MKKKPFFVKISSEENAWNEFESDFKKAKEKLDKNLGRKVNFKHLDDWQQWKKVNESVIPGHPWWWWYDTGYYYNHNYDQNYNETNQENAEFTDTGSDFSGGESSDSNQ